MNLSILQNPRDFIIFDTEHPLPPAGFHLKTGNGMNCAPSNAMKPSCRQTQPRRTHFTLVEVGIAVLITAIIAAAAIALINTVQWNMVRTHRTSRAMAIANSRIEHLQNTHFIDLSLYEEQGMPVDERGVPAGDGIYSRTTLIGTETNSACQVTVEVRAPWKANLPEIVVSLTTVLIDPQILDTDL